MAERGLFVTFEGIDGCGKTSQIRILAERLRALGIEPVIAQEPGGTRIGRLIRGVLLDSANADIDPKAELLLYVASRAQNVTEVIRPALDCGRVVLCDRFNDATVAYQGHGRGLGAGTVSRLTEIACEGTHPDLTLWLDLDPETALGRARARNQGKNADESRMEAMPPDFFQRVRDGYSAIGASEPERVRRVDAEGSVDDVAREIFGIVEPALRERGLLPR